MDEEDFTRLQELILQDRIILEVSRSYAGAAFGGPIGGCLFTLIVLAALVAAVVLLIKGLWLYAVLAVVGIVLLFIVWQKVAFYYFYARSLRNYEFFCAAYRSRFIRLRHGEDGPVVAHPMSWRSALRLDGNLD